MIFEGLTSVSYTAFYVLFHRSNDDFFWTKQMMVYDQISFFVLPIVWFELFFDVLGLKSVNNYGGKIKRWPKTQTKRRNNTMDLKLISPSDGALASAPSDAVTKRGSPVFFHFRAGVVHFRAQPSRFRA